MNEAERVLSALSSLRVPAMPEEYEIHAAISTALEGAGLSFAHEYRLGPGRRVDFVCGRVGIEVKKGRPVASRLREQIARYLTSPALDAMIVVMQKPCPLPAEIAGKAVYVISLNRLWGVALP